jgi:hypothetical protein
MVTDRDARWWDDSPAAREIKEVMGTPICWIDRVSVAAHEGDEAAIAYCEAAGWDFIVKEGL